MATSTQELTNALDSLRTALQDPYSNIVRDAAIRRFVFCIELSWKVLKKDNVFRDRIEITSAL